MNECKHKGECVNCGQYIFDQDLTWIANRFAGIEKNIKYLQSHMDTLIKRLIFTKLEGGTE